MSIWKASGVAERVMIDTGPIIAFLSKDDVHHDRCIHALTALVPPLFTCWPVITEAAWLLRKRPETVAKMFEGFTGGFFALLPLTIDDMPAVAAMPRALPPVSALASTKSMSMPGTMMMPKRRVK